MPTTNPPPKAHAGCLTRGIQGLLIACLSLCCVCFVGMAVGDYEPVTWSTLAVGLPVAGLLVLCLPGNDSARPKDRLTFALFALGAATLVYLVAHLLNPLVPECSAKDMRTIAGPVEEALKLVAALVLARATLWASERPTRLVILAIAVGLGCAGIETITKLPTFHPRAVFNRWCSLFNHAAYTGIAASGFVLASYLRHRIRWVLPILTFSAGAGAHIVNNRYLKVIHGWLLAHVDPLPPIMTSEQWFGAPHYDTLWVLVKGGSTLIWVGLLVLLIFRIHHLAQAHEARP